VLHIGSAGHLESRKLLVTALVGAQAREHPEVHVVGFDPGVMPGTGLARHQPAAARAMWRC
jgi:hypothetical protein